MSLPRYSRRRFVALASAAGLTLSQKKLFSQETPATYIYTTDRTLPALSGDTLLKVTTESDTMGDTAAFTRVTVSISTAITQLDSGFITEVRWEGPDGTAGDYRDVTIRALGVETPRLLMEFDLVLKNNEWFFPEDLGQLRSSSQSIGVFRDDEEAFFERNRPLLEKLLEDTIEARGSLPKGNYRMKVGELFLMNSGSEPLLSLNYEDRGSVSETGTVYNAGTITRQSLTLSALSEANTMRLEFNRVQNGEFDRTVLVRNIPLDSVKVAFSTIAEEVVKHRDAYLKGEAHVKQTGGCTISTAVCGVIGLPDDCFELRTLRSFRDECMRPEEVDEYRAWSERLLGSPFFTTKAGMAALRRFYFRTILPAVGLRLLGLNERVYRCYRKGVARLDSAVLRHSA